MRRPRTTRRCAQEAQPGWDDENFGTGEVPQWFHYFDAFDRLIEVKHIPDATDTNTYSIYQFFWLGNRPIYYVQIDFPGQTTTRRYLHADELNRPLEAYSHPSSGNTERVWAINPDLFGWDDVIEGASVYQPLRFPGQLVEPETTAWVDFGDPARPPLHDNHYRVYDPFTGMYLQTDPEIARTWSSYGYAENDPVAKTDPLGLWVDRLGTNSGESSWGYWETCVLESGNSNCGGLDINPLWWLDFGGIYGGAFIDPTPPCHDPCGCPVDPSLEECKSLHLLPDFEVGRQSIPPCKRTAVYPTQEECMGCMGLAILHCESCLQVKGVSGTCQAVQPCTAMAETLCENRTINPWDIWPPDEYLSP
jgi:RHS repeat-associated protein